MMQFHMMTLLDVLGKIAWVRFSIFGGGGGGVSVCVGGGGGLLPIYDIVRMCGPE